MPRSGAIHRDRALENISIAFRSEGLIAPQLLPAVPVKHESNVYFVYDKDTLATPKTLRANGAQANEADYNLSTQSYRLDEQALKHLVTDRDRANADPAIKPDVDATEFLTDMINREFERQTADLVGTAANWGNTTSLTSTLAWSANTTLSNPILVIDSAASSVVQNCSRKPNTVVLDFRTFQAAKEHTSVVDRVKHTSSDSVTEQILAKLFNVPMLLNAHGAEDTSDEGLASSVNFIWTDMAYVAYIERSPGLKKPSALYCLKSNSFGTDTRVRRFRDEERMGDWIEVARMYDLISPSSDCAYLIVNTVQ